MLMRAKPYLSTIQDEDDDLPLDVIMQFIHNRAQSDCQQSDDDFHCLLNR